MHEYDDSMLESSGGTSGLPGSGAMGLGFDGNGRGRFAQHTPGNGDGKKVKVGRGGRDSSSSASSASAVGYAITGTGTQQMFEATPDLSMVYALQSSRNLYEEKTTIIFEKIIEESGESGKNKEKSDRSLLDKTLADVFHQAKCLREMGKFESARKSLLQALEIARQPEVQKSKPMYVLAVLSSLGTVCLAIPKRRSRGISYYNEVIALARKSNNKKVESALLGARGDAYTKMGKYKQAQASYKQRLDICRVVGDELGKGRAYSGLGRVAHELGQYEKAVEYHLNHLRLAEECKNGHEQAGACRNLGNTYHALKDYKRAVSCHIKDLKLQDPDNAKQGATYSNLGNVGCWVTEGMGQG